MDRITRVLHTRIDDTDANPVVTPIYQSSAFQSSSPFFYTRKNNPNIEEFETVISTLEDAKYCVATTTGMSAIAIVLNLLQPNETLVVNKDIYGCSFKLFQKFASRMRINLQVIDLSTEDGISQIPDNSNMILFETPTNPFLKTVDIRKVAEKTKKTNPHALIVVDNTWATPLFQQPLKWGADISLHSATKYFSGHSDVMGGIILTDLASVYENVLEQRFYYGAILEPYSAWLLRRSMQTFALRMQAHQITTVAMKNFLEAFSQIKKVYYPQIDGKQLTGYGTLIFFELKDEFIKYYKQFTESLELFDTGTGMACVTSMVAQPYTGSHASMTNEEKCSMGLEKGLVRLSFGLENINDLKMDIENAFNRISNLHLNDK